MYLVAELNQTRVYVRADDLSGSHFSEIAARELDSSRQF